MKGKSTSTLEGKKRLSEHWGVEGLLRWASGKELICQCRKCETHEFNAWVGKIPWRRACDLLLENPHGQRNLVGYSP